MNKGKCTHLTSWKKHVSLHEVEFENDASVTSWQILQSDVVMHGSDAHAYAGRLAHGSINIDNLWFS